MDASSQIFGSSPAVFAEQLAWGEAGVCERESRTKIKPSCKRERRTNIVASSRREEGGVRRQTVIFRCLTPLKEAAAVVRPISSPLILNLLPKEVRQRIRVTSRQTSEQRLRDSPAAQRERERERRPHI